ncbi:hypothetical protein PAQ31011_03709 [Pandoraea aquatica]|uniref:Uncharacterized protein n=1 Tax=Pandoraea aquatica TaxID=2508290 RepID=A0A5E4X6D8_9BURK|nr:RICIN domain-containing protein [Pandoraea aquatica]VVE31879.1 hypothetical protein PAQ31011_03709 [Pandoraea aquatica]
MKHRLMAVAMVSALICAPALSAPAAGPGPIKAFKGDALACLNASADGDNISLEACDGSKGQLWRIDPVDTGNYFIHNSDDDSRCLTAVPWSGGLVLKQCDGDLSLADTWIIGEGRKGGMLLRNGAFSDPEKQQSLNYDAKRQQLGLSPSSDATDTQWYRLQRTRPPRTDLIGTKKLLFVPVSFTDYPYNYPSEILDILFGTEPGMRPFSFWGYIDEVSRGKLNLVDARPDARKHPVPEIVDLGAVPENCDPEAIIKATQDALHAKKIDLSQYDYFLIDTPMNVGACYGKDFAEPSNRWMVSMGLGGVRWIAPLFGRIAGFSDATTIGNCKQNHGQWHLNANCTTTTMEDITDPMSLLHNGTYPVNYQRYAGWLTEDDDPLVLDADPSTTFTLAAIWTKRPAGSHGSPAGAAAPVGLRIPRKDGSELQLEYRRPDKRFDDWDDNSPLATGVTIRVSNPLENIIASSIVDPTNTPSGPRPVQTSLQVGQSLYDDLSQRIITVLGVDGNVAKIQIKPMTGPATTEDQ